MNDAAACLTTVVQYSMRPGDSAPSHVRLIRVELAKAADLHENKLSYIVNGHTEPSDAERKALARILKRRVAALFPHALAS